MKSCSTTFMQVSDQSYVIIEHTSHAGHKCVLTTANGGFQLIQLRAKDSIPILGGTSYKFASNTKDC